MQLDDIKLLKHARVYVLADYFQIDGLKALALKRFKGKLNDFWKSDTLVDCISEVYNTTRDDDVAMREAVVDAVKSNLKELWKSKAF